MLSIIVVDLPLQLENTHYIVTRSKAGIYKTKALIVELLDREPRTIDEVFAHKEWKVTTQDEYDALICNRTWELVPLPPRRKAVGCKWLFKIKQNPNVTVAWRKGRLVAKGCSHVLWRYF